MKTLIIILTVACLSGCVQRMLALSPEEREIRMEMAQTLMQQGNQMMWYGQTMQTPAVNRYYAPPGTVIVPGY